MTRTQRTYTKEFKKEAVELVSSTGQSIAKIADDLGIPSSNLHRWRRELNENGPTAFPGNGNAGDRKLAELKRELQRVRIERDILKNGHIRSNTGDRGTVMRGAQSYHPNAKGLSNEWIDNLYRFGRSRGHFHPQLDGR